MCCWTKVDGLPTDPEAQQLVVAILDIAGFKHNKELMADPGRYWIREFQPHVGDGTKRSITCDYNGDRIDFHLVPIIQSHTYQNHAVVGFPAAILFNTVNVIAEKLSGRIEQIALMGFCTGDDRADGLHGYSQRTLANYKENIPFKFEHVCRGFREVMHKGIHQVGGDWELKEETDG